MSSELTKSVVNGAAWSSVSQIATQGLRLVCGIILARILAPDDFGLVAMVAVVTVVTGNLIDMGFIEALVQRREITHTHLSTIYWVILATGITLCFVVMDISPLVAHFFNDDRVAPLLAMTSIIFIIQSAGAVQSAILRRKLLFFKITLSDIGDAVGYMAGALPSACCGLGVWSLVIGNITGCVPGVIMRCLFAEWQPSFIFRRASFQELWNFGINNLGMRIVYIVIDKLDILIMGRFLTPAVLGFYSQAWKWSRLPSDSLSAIGNRIGLPALSLVQNDNKRLQRGLLKCDSFLSIIGLPVFAGMAIMAPEIILTILGHKWIETIVPFQILCISGAITILNIGIPAVFLARGQPDINLKLSLFHLGLLVPSLFVGVRFGAEGVAAVVSAVSLASWIIRQRYVHQVIRLGFKEYLFSLKPAFIATLTMSAAVLALRFILLSMFNLPDTVLVITGSVWGCLIYFAALKAGKSRAMNEMISLATEIIKPCLKLRILRILPEMKRNARHQFF